MLEERMRRISASTAVGLAALLGCAEAYDLPKSGEDPAEAGTDLGPRFLDAAAPGTGGVPAEGTVPPGGCVPGLCLTCDAEGRVVVPPDDPNCPALSCSELDAYTLKVEGETSICERSVHLGDARGCAAAGRCRAVAEATACEAPRAFEAARSSGPCQTVLGCAPGEMPAPGPAGAGQPCGAGGICRADGTCDEAVAESCGAFAGAQICDEGVSVMGDRYCDIAAVDGMNCIDHCVRAGGLCLGAFQATPEAPCAEGMPTGCATAGPNLRCRCRNPN
jgi:hypothetical protein